MISKERKEWAKAFFDKCEAKIDWVVDTVKTDQPIAIAPGEKEYSPGIPFNWMCGFWGGMMWLLYLQTGKEKYKARAIRCSERLNDAFILPEGFNIINGHDLGFTYGITNIPHYKILGDEDAQRRAFHAALLLAGRYNPNGEYIVAWSKPNPSMPGNTNGVAIIDCLLNLPLLYWATEVTGDLRFATIAKKHVDMAEREFIKPDGSVYHIVNKDPKTGEVVGHPKGQGYAEGTSWSRGQSWGVYGFLMSYIHTGDKKLLEASKRVANYVISSFGDHKLAPVDYMQPQEPEYVDASANAITACGMLELAKHCEGEEAQKYIDFAFKLLENLYDDCEFGDKNEAIVQSGAQMYADADLRRPFIYADYFLIESLVKIMGETDYFMW